MANEQWQRRLKLLQFLMMRGYAQTAEIAKYLNVDKRIARDDLMTLHACGVPLKHPSLEAEKKQTDRETVWQIDGTWVGIGLKSNFMLRLSLLLGREVIGHYLRDTDFSRNLADLDRQVKALTTEIEDQDIERRFYMKQEPAKNYGERSDLLSELTVALIHRAPISFTYTSAAGHTRRYEREQPLTLVMYRRGLYIALRRKKGPRKVLSLAVDRIEDLHLHMEDDDEPFSYPPVHEYDPKALFDDIFGLFDDGQPAQEVVLRFPAEGSQAYVREREWMPNQTIEFFEDGSTVVRFRARGGELAFRILEYGPFCEVIAPLELREKVAQLARDTAAMYDPSAPLVPPSAPRPRRTQA